MIKIEKLNEIKRLFHNSKDLQKASPRDIYAQAFHDGLQTAYIEVIEILMTETERKNMLDWLWDI